MTRSEAQPAWEKIVELGFSDYDKLTRAQRVWFNVEALIVDGLWDHYMNHEADNNAQTIEDLEYLNFHSVANQLRDFNTIYFKDGVPKGPDARWVQFDKFPEDEREIYIEDMDKKFWNVSDDLEKALHEHINNTGIGEI